MKASLENLSRQEIRDVLRRHEGAITTLAAELGVSTQAVSGWFRGAPSKRIGAACLAKAIALLGMEQRQGGPVVPVTGVSAIGEGEAS
jgi:hypothetical protein